MRKMCGALLVMVTATTASFTNLAGAQSAGGTSLSLAEAISLAKANNPSFLQLMNQRRRTEANLRAAYGAFLPTASTSLGGGFRQGKQELVNGVSFGSTSDILSSSWGLNLNYNFSARTLTNLRSARASIEASDADIANSEQLLRTTVTQQYLSVLQQQSLATLQDTLVAYNQLQLDLAKAKAGVGSATSLDVKRAEVVLGTQQVAALRAHNNEAIERLRLFQQLGVPAQPTAQLTSNIPVVEPTLSQAQLLEMAATKNPALLALKSREVVSAQNYRAARAGYLPTFGANASLGGAAQTQTNANALVASAQRQTLSSAAACFSQDSLRRGAGLSGIPTCGAIVFTPAQESAIRSANDKWPFGFNSNPLNISVGLSLNLFDGFNRERNIESAAADQLDSRYNIRAQELKLTADVSQAFTTLTADYRALRLQEQNTVAAREALQLAQERYRVGLNSLVDLQQARADFERAETDRINAIFEYHRAFAALESAVGRSLR